MEISKPVVLEPIRIIDEENGNEDPQMRHLYVSMRSERKRLDSFSNPRRWPVDFIDARELARAGFFYLQNSDRVQCPFCLGIVSSWEPGDRPLQEHQRHYRRCRFICGYEVGNIPIGRDPIRDDHLVGGRDECGHRTEGAHNPTIGRNLIQVRNVDRRVNEETFGQLGVKKHRTATHRKFVTYEARLASFNGKMDAFVTTKLTAPKLAEAGFFKRAGLQGDQVACFFCNGGLQNWERNDDPWVEHAINYPSCQFVFLNRGSDFIENCEARKKLAAETKELRSVMKNDPLAKMAVKKWLKNNLVQQLIEIRSPPEDVLLDVLGKRWIEKQKMFEQFTDLQTAIEASMNAENPRLVSANEDEGVKSSDSGNDEDIKSSDSGNHSPLSSSPESEKEKLMCKICLDKHVGVLFLPCGHVVACAECATGVSECPICRAVIEGSVRTFFS